MLTNKEFDTICKLTDEVRLAERILFGAKNPHDLVEASHYLSSVETELEKYLVSLVPDNCSE